MRTIRAKFKVGQDFRNCKEKIKLTKCAEQNFIREIFRFNKIIKRIARPVFELEDLNKIPIEGKFYKEELSPVSITKENVYKIGKC